MSETHSHELFQFVDFLSNVGGIVGVLTGLSVVTLIEFAFTLFQVLYTLTTNKLI